MSCFEDFQEVLNSKGEKSLELGTGKDIQYADSPAVSGAAASSKATKATLRNAESQPAPKVTDRPSCLPFGMWKTLCIFKRKEILLSFADF